MSAGAVEYVYRHSPYTGATFAIHLAIADTVNDTFNNEFWMATASLATKTRTSRRTVQKALDTLLNDEFMRVVKPANQHAPTTYQFLFPPVDIVFDTRPGAQSVHPGAQSEPSGAQSVHSGAQSVRPNPITQENPKEHSPSSDDSEFDTWWNIYPRKDAKQDARKAWKTVTKTADPATIIEATRQQTSQPDSPLNRERRYIPYPASWLRAGHYLDTPLPAPEKEVRPYDTQPTQCDTCDGTRYISTEDEHGRSWATPCGDCQ